MPSGTYIEPLTPCWREHSARGANRTGNYSYHPKKKKNAGVGGRVAPDNFFIPKSKKSNCFLRKTPDNLFFIPKSKNCPYGFVPPDNYFLFLAKKTPVWLHTRTGNYSYNLKKKKIARVASHNINLCKSNSCKE